MVDASLVQGRLRSRPAASSSPTTPASELRPPSAATPAAAFAAPPGTSFRRATSTTGTGASGEIRDTAPQTYSSSITSPIGEHAHAREAVDKPRSSPFTPRPG